MKKILKPLLTLFLSLCIGVTPMQIKACEQTEFDRFVTFMKDNPSGGNFILKEDMHINTDIYTNHQTYKIETNGHQLSIESFDVFISNRDPLDEWEEEPVDLQTIPLRIKGDASLKPLISVKEGVSLSGVYIEAYNGIAVELDDGAYIGGNDGFHSQITTLGNSAVAINIKGSYNEDYYAPSITGVDLNIYDGGTAIKGNWLQYNYSIIRLYQNAKAFDVPVENLKIGEFVKIFENGIATATNWKIISSLEQKDVSALAHHKMKDLPLPFIIPISIQNKKTTEIRKLELPITYNEEEYKKGMQQNKPFVLHGNFDENYQLQLGLDKNIIEVRILPNQQVPFELTLGATNTNSYYFQIPRAYGATSIRLYIGDNSNKLTYLGEYITSLKHIGVGTSIPSSHITLSVRGVEKKIKYARVEIVGGYYDGRSSLLQLYKDNENEKPPIVDKDDGSGDGAHGQGGGREEPGYEPPKGEIVNPPTQEEIKPPTQETIKPPTHKPSKSILQTGNKGTVTSQPVYDKMNEHHYLVEEKTQLSLTKQEKLESNLALLSKFISEEFKEIDTRSQHVLITIITYVMNYEVLLKDTYSKNLSSLFTFFIRLLYW